MQDRSQDDKTIVEYAEKVIRLARDTITVRFRFFDNALGKIIPVPRIGLGGYMTDGEKLYYDPHRLLKDYMDEPNVAVRLYLHIMFHVVFLHPYRYDKQDEHYWNIASDIAVEYVILQLDLPGASMMKDDEERARIAKIRKWVPEITADKLYREFCVGGISKDSEREYERLFTMDMHRPRASYKDEPETLISEEDWRKISERVKAELKSFSKSIGGDESIAGNLEEATRTRYDYGAILRKFAVQGEEIRVNPDEFDYVYYTYGLRYYGNLPLIEPLEYTEIRRVKEFVIVIDTSASCRGALVKAFLRKTVDILNSTENFFHHVNIHIIQCDSQVQEDTRITCMEDLEAFIAEGKLTGFGATDFRPAFQYVNGLVESKAFENLKGLIYLTDGYGVYPDRAPGYDTIFAFLGEDRNRPPVPVWAIQVVLDTDERNF